jgi:hypothetical protein
VALYGLTHISLNDEGRITTARVRGISPTMPAWMGKAVDMDAGGVAALISAPNKVVAIFDDTEDRPQNKGGQFQVVREPNGQVGVMLATESPGQSMRDLPKI